MSFIAHLSRIAVSASCTLATSLSLAAPLYRYVDLGPNTLARDINAQGAIAGGVDGLDGTAAIMRDGVWHTRPAGDLAMAIDNQGEVIARRKTVQGSYDAVYWPRGGAPVEVTMPFASGQVLALGVANGRVTGYASDEVYDTHCFVWSADTATAIDLGVGRDGYCTANDINYAGQVVGQIAPPDSGPDTGFIWQDGSFQYLGLLPGGTWSSANAINRKGHVAMTATRLRHDGVLVWRPALWNGERIVDLGTIDRSRQCEALALNDHDEVVGRCVPLGNQPWKPVLYTGGQMYWLESLVENLDGRSLGQPEAINEDGTIVGTSRLDGVEHGYRLERVAEGVGAK